MQHGNCDIARGEWASGNIFIRPVHLRTVGEHIDGHTHAFDHTTIVFLGAVHIKATSPEGEVVEQDFHAPSHFLVKADWRHAISALEDETIFWCVYSHRNPQGEVVQNSGWTGAY